MPSNIKNGMTSLPLWLFLLALATAVQQVHANTEQINFRTKVPVEHGDDVWHGATRMPCHGLEAQHLRRHEMRPRDSDVRTPLWPGVIHTETMPSSTHSYPFSYTLQLGMETHPPPSMDRPSISQRKPSLKLLGFVDFVVRWGLNVTPLDGARRLLAWMVSNGTFGGEKTQDWEEGWWTARISWPATVSCFERQP